MVEKFFVLKSLLTELSPMVLGHLNYYGELLEKVSVREKIIDAQNEKCRRLWVKNLE
jgi:hypothetical protein